MAPLHLLPNFTLSKSDTILIKGARTGTLLGVNCCICIFKLDLIFVLSGSMKEVGVNRIEFYHLPRIAGLDGIICR